MAIIIGCKGSDDPQMCLHCEREVCVLDLPLTVNRGTGGRISFMTPEERKVFGAELRALRKEKGFSIREVADLLGVAHSTYENWETGHSAPDTERAERLRQVFQGILPKPDDHEKLPFGKALRRCRERARMSQAAVAKFAGVSHSRVCEWENKDVIPQRKQLEKLQELFPEIRQEVTDETVFEKRVAR